MLVPDPQEGGGGEGGVPPPFLGPENIFSSFILQEIDWTWIFMFETFL